MARPAASRARRVLGVATVAAVLVALAGCTDSTSQEQRMAAVQERVRELFAPISEQSSFRVELESSAPGAEGTVDMIQHVEDGVVTSAEVVRDVGGELVVYRLVDERLYIDDGGTGWLSLAADDPDLAELGFGLEELDVVNSDEDLVAGAVAVEDVPGRRLVDGVSTRVVDVQVDPRRMTGSDSFVGAFGVDTFPARLNYRLLVDEEGLVRRSTCRFRVGGQPVDLVTTVSEFGEVDDVEVPVESVAVTARELLDTQA